MRSIKVLLSTVFIFCHIHIIGQSPLDKLTSQMTEEIMDSIVLANMKDYQVPGMTYAIVRKDSMFTIKAHGLANILSGEKMTTKHKFMLGSLSKIVTATAIMQLVEEGLLDLDKDVNNYLEAFKLSKKITLRQLLTHTAGFEERGFNRVRLNAEDMIPLEEYLKKNLPDIIFEPGSMPAYSNHGVALAGYILQEVSEKPFETYMNQNLFQPLEMNESSFVLDEKSKAGLATPYLINNNKLTQTHLEYVQTIPASMLIGNAEDMANFMAVHLNQGRFKDWRLLKPSTLEIFHNKQYSPHPDLKGRAIGFFENWHGSLRGLSHGNTRNGFVSYMLLLPEEEMGIFVTINGGRGQFRDKVIDDFLSAIYPEEPASDIGPAHNINQIKKYEGTYISSRRNESRIESLFHYIMINKFVKVKAVGDTALSIFGRKFILKNENLFVDTQDAIPLVFGNEGREIKTIFLGGRSDAYNRIAWHANLGIPVTIFVLAFLIFLLYVSKFFWKSWINKKSLVSKTEKSQFMISLSGLLFIMSFSISIGVIQENIQYGIPWFFYLIFSLPFIYILFYLVFLFQVISKWKELVFKWKLEKISFLLVGGLFLWQLYYWNFIGYNF